MAFYFECNHPWSFEGVALIVWNRGMPDQPVVTAKFISRPNRFVVAARLEDGTEVGAHLPNTGRLEQLMNPGNALLLRHDALAHRKTEYTVTRAWDGCWVGLEASVAPRLLSRWLRENPFPIHGPVRDVRREVRVGGHRLDLVLECDDGVVWVEVKSGSRAADGRALLSKTPSARAVKHLAALSDLAARGDGAAAAFVIQRSDVDSLFVGGDADGGWVEAVRSAQENGVVITAFGCDVTPTEVEVDRVLPVLWD